MYNQNYLAHYGVLGMKWGRRRAQKKTYGLSKREVQNKINTSGKSSLGSVNKRYRDEFTKAMKDSGLSAKFKQLDSDSDKLDYNQHTKRWNELNREAKKIRKEIAKKFVDEFNTATLKDIDYKDIELGKKMLNEYNLDFQVSDLGVVKRTKFGIRVY